MIMKEKLPADSCKTKTPASARPAKFAALCLSAGLLASPAVGASLDFQLLTWNDADATAQLPSAVGLKPSATMPAAGDWLVFTGDDAGNPAPNNPAGAVSHNLVDITGAGGAGFNLAPSLSGTLTLDLEPTDGSNWTVTVTALAYSGQANPAMAMNQFLVAPGSPATTNDAFNVDGIGNAGQWIASATGNWAIQYALDFYFAANVDGDPSPTDIDATFNDKAQAGYLIPVDRLTTNGLAGATLVDPAGFYNGDFAQYLLTEIAPRLPANATYLLVTQMGKTHPGYVETGLPVTVNTLVGNTTIAYTTQTLAEAPRILSLRFMDGKPVIQFTGSATQSYQIQRSENLVAWETIANPALTYPQAGIVEWTNLNPADEHEFYRVIALTP
jgi:hypothetical protein